MLMRPRTAVARYDGGNGERPMAACRRGPGEASKGSAGLGEGEAVLGLERMGLHTMTAGLPVGAHGGTADARGGEPAFRLGKSEIDQTDFDGGYYRP